MAGGGGVAVPDGAATNLPDGTKAGDLKFASVDAMAIDRQGRVYGDLALGILDQSGTLPAGTTVRDIVLPPSTFAAGTSRPATPPSAACCRLELDRLRLDAPRRPDDRWGAAPGGAGRAADPPAGPAGPRRADSRLDVEGVAWLADYVTTRVGALVVVTHDQWFLDEVYPTTSKIAEGDVLAYDGGYSAYTLARAERARIATAPRTAG